MMNSTAERTLGSSTPRLFEHPGGDAVPFAHQAQQEVLGADVVVVEALGFFLGERQDFARPLRELVEFVRHPWLSQTPGDIGRVAVPLSSRYKMNAKTSRDIVTSSIPRHPGKSGPVDALAASLLSTLGARLSCYAIWRYVTKATEFSINTRFAATSHIHRTHQPRTKMFLAAHLRR